MDVTWAGNTSLRGLEPVLTYEAVHSHNGPLDEQQSSDESSKKSAFEEMKNNYVKVMDVFRRSKVADAFRSSVRKSGEWISGAELWKIMFVFSAGLLALVLFMVALLKCAKCIFLCPFRVCKTILCH